VSSSEYPDINADPLDAALVTHWGLDDFAQRLNLSARLVDRELKRRPDPSINMMLVPS
jgi:hypothetical protein